MIMVTLCKALQEACALEILFAKEPFSLLFNFYLYTQGRQAAVKERGTRIRGGIRRQVECTDKIRIIPNKADHPGTFMFSVVVPDSLPHVLLSLLLSLSNLSKYCSHCQVRYITKQSFGRHWFFFFFGLNQ